MEKIYAVNIMDYGTPSFIFSYVTHFGEKEAILKLLSKENIDRDDLLNAANEYFSNKGPGLASIFGESEHPIIHECKILKETELIIDNFKDEFMNVWDCPYFIGADKVVCHVIYLEDDNRIVRVVKPQMYNFKFGVSEDNLSPLGMRPWGHPGMINVSKENTLSSALYVEDRAFERNEDVEEEDLINNPEIDFSGFYFEIFGDG